MATQWATTGAAQGLGDGSSEANRIELKKVIEDDAALASALAAGDIINVKNDGTLIYDGSAGVFATTAVAGTAIARIQVRPYTTTADDGGVITIQDSDAGATNYCFEIDHDYWSFENMILEDVRRGFNMDLLGGLSFHNIRISNIVDAGTGFARGGTAQAPNHYSRCFTDGGAEGWNDNGRVGTFYHCTAIGASVAGFELEAIVHQGTLVGCLAHDCAIGFKLGGGWASINCTANRCATDGWLYTDDDTPITMINSAATSCGGYGLNASSTTLVDAFNCAFDATNEENTSGPSHANVTLHEHGAITADPEYTDGDPATNTDVDLTSVPWVHLGLGRHVDEATTPTPPVGIGDDDDPPTANTYVITTVRRMM